MAAVAVAAEVAVAPAVRRLYATAHRQLRANLTTDRRRTAGDGLAVYGRPGRPCPRCGTPIRRVVQGQRATYFCPRCQV